MAEELLDDLECMSSENARLSNERLRSLLSHTEPSPALDLPPTADRGGSPYRSATYDLACNYTLAQALSRASSPNASSSSSGGRSGGGVGSLGELEVQWMRSVSARLRPGLLRPSGGERGEADRAVRFLFEEVPVVREGGGLLDTVRLAEEVLRERERCAEVWREVLAEVPQQHLELERAALEELL